MFHFLGQFITHDMALAADYTFGKSIYNHFYIIRWWFKRSIKCLLGPTRSKLVPNG